VKKRAMMLAAVETVTEADPVWLPRRHNTQIAAQATAGELVHAPSPLKSSEQHRVVSVRSRSFGAAFQPPGQEFVDPGDRVVGDLGEYGAEIGFGIDAAHLGGLDQRQDAGSALATFVRAGEQPVLPFMQSSA
jgi:hypothetical protein